MCEELGFIRLVYFGKNILDIIYIIVPILLILMLAVDLGKMVMSSDVDGARKKAFPMIVRRTIATAAIFFLPALLFYLISLTEVNSSSDGLLCWNKANMDTITKLEIKKKAEDALREKEREEKRKEEEKKKQEQAGNVVVKGVPNSNSYKPFVNGVQRDVKKGECMKKEDNCFCPTVGANKGFQFTLESETGRSFNWTNRSDKMVSVQVQCSDGSVIRKTVNINSKDNFEKAFQKVCQLRTTGINGIRIASSKIVLDGTLVERLNSARTICSPHAYGNAIDINYGESVVVNGVTYKPWAGQGNTTKVNYDAFVKAIGRESDIRNVNYILWKYAFEPSGFTWGGNWSSGSFDPMHYEAK